MRMKHIVVSGAVAAALVLGTGYTGCPVKAENYHESMILRAEAATIALTQGTDITKTLNKALAEARDTATDNAPVRIVLPTGTYTISAALHLYSNTVLDLNGSVLTYTGENTNMIMTGTNDAYQGVDSFNFSEKNKGYDGVKNIEIKNGTVKGSKKCTASLLKLQHATNVKLSGLVVTGGACKHQAEIAAIDGFYVTDCTFSDMQVKADTGEKCEALQLDIPCSSDVYPGSYEDGTVMRNVEITGCTFKNVPRGLGTHTLLQGAYHENIKINNNTFTDIYEEAIVALSYVNCEIKNNKIQNCGAGILCQLFKSPDDKASMYTTIFDGKQAYGKPVVRDAKTEISGNTISVQYTASTCEKQGIRVEGRVLESNLTVADKSKIPAGDYRISGVVVKNNKITTAGCGIHMIGAVDCQVENNEITGKGYQAKDPNKSKYDGIFVEANAENVVVNANVISGVTRDGIFVQNNSSVKEITNHKISNCDGQGIHMFQDVKVLGNISNNQMNQCMGGGILASTDCVIGAIVDNSMDNMIKKSNKSDGICIYMNSTVQGDIANNNIAKANGAGITITTNSKVGGAISKNTLKTIKKNGIFIYKNSTVNKDINENRLSTITLNGIMVNDKATVTGQICKNVIKNPSGRAIYVYDAKKKSTVCGDIRENTITGAKKVGIDIASSKNNLCIVGNKISSGKADGIMINVSKGLVSVLDNTVTGNGKVNAIRVVKGKTLISGNKISKAKVGVLINKAAKADIMPNKYGKKVTSQLWLAGTTTKNTTKKTAVKKVVSSGGKLTVVAASIANTKNYAIQYSTDSTFTKNVKTVTVAQKKDADPVKCTVKKLKKGTKYYVRVSGYTDVKGKRVYYGFGKAKQIVIK